MKLSRFYLIPALLLLTFVFLVGPSTMMLFAHAADAAPETVAQATTDTNRVVWAYGASVTQWASAVAWLIVSGLMIAFRSLPANIVAIFGNARVETLLNNAIGYGINAVAEASKGKTLDVNVGNAVLAKALQYVLDNAPSWLQSWAGGPEGLAKKIWSRLNLGDGASDEAVPAIVAAAVSNKAA